MVCVPHDYWAPWDSVCTGQGRSPPAPAAPTLHAATTCPPGVLPAPGSNHLLSLASASGNAVAGGDTCTRNPRTWSAAFPACHSSRHLHRGASGTEAHRVAHWAMESCSEHFARRPTGCSRSSLLRRASGWQPELHDDMSASSSFPGGASRDEDCSEHLAAVACLSPSQPASSRRFGYCVPEPHRVPQSSINNCVAPIISPDQTE